MLDINDVYEVDSVSDCCGESVYINGICSSCNDHCSVWEFNEEDEDSTNDFWDTESDARDFYQQQYKCARYLIRDVFTTPMLIKLRDWIDECVKENQGGG